jgi:hypothetical protein
MPVAGGGGVGAPLPALGRIVVRRPYQQDEATMLRTAGRQGARCRQWRRRSPRGRGGRRGGGGWGEGQHEEYGQEAGEDGAEEAGAGRGVSEAARVPGADSSGPAAWRGVRALADFGRPAAAENPVGQRTGGAAEGGGQGG